MNDPDEGQVAPRPWAKAAQNALQGPRTAIWALNARAFTVNLGKFDLGV